MINPRNIQDVIPSGFSISRCQAFGRSVADQIGYKPGSPMLKVLEGFGGEYRNVASVFGRDGDVYLIQSGGGLIAEHEAWPTLEWHSPMLNEILAEGLGHKFLHYPLVVQKHGENAGMGVPRHSKTEADRTARQEAIHFMIGFLAPNAGIVDACRAGLDDEAIGQRFGVTQRLAGARRKALHAQIHAIAHVPA